jgi:hypothetical protein
LKIQPIAVKEVMSDWLPINRESGAEIITNLGEIFSRRIFQSNFSLVAVLEQIRDLIFSGISEGIGVIKSADVCRRKGEIPFLSLAPSIFRTHYQKVTGFLFFCINCFKLLSEADNFR